MASRCRGSTSSALCDQRAVVVQATRSALPFSGTERARRKHGGSSFGRRPLRLPSDVSSLAYLPQEPAEIGHASSSSQQGRRRALHLGQIKNQPCPEMVRLHSQFERFEFVFQHYGNLDELSWLRMLKPPAHQIQIDIGSNAPPEFLSGSVARRIKDQIFRHKDSPSRGADNLSVGNDRAGSSEPCRRLVKCRG